VDELVVAGITTANSNRLCGAQCARDVVPDATDALLRKDIFTLNLFACEDQHTFIRCATSHPAPSCA
jgi:hypothetical protein